MIGAVQAQTPSLFADSDPVSAASEGCVEELADVYPRFPVAVHIFLLRGEQVLMLRRSNTGYEDGRLSVVAGHVEPGETVTQAAIRETLEEVGIELRSDRLQVVGVMHRRSLEERIDFFLAYNSEVPDPRNLETGKCSELVWATLGTLPPDTIPYVRVALENMRKGIWFQEFGWEGDVAVSPTDAQSRS